LDIYLLCRALTRPCYKPPGEGLGLFFSHPEATRPALHDAH